MSLIHFFNADKTFRFSKKQFLKQAIIDLFTSEDVSLKNLNYIFCSDVYLLKINNDFLKHNYFTDVITFPLSVKGEPVTGEIYISLDRIKDNANINKATVFDETLRVVSHGALHLCGYNDKSKSEQTIMRLKESMFIKMFHVKTSKT